LHVTTRAETDRRILDDAFVAFRKESLGLQAGLQAQKFSIRQWFATGRLIKPLAAAAVIIIAVGLFFSGPGENFDSVEDFYRNLGGVSNICVSTFEPGQTNPTQQVWTSQDLKVRLFKTGIGDRARYALLDLADKVETKMYLSNVETEPLTEEKLRDLRQSMMPSFALAPFFSKDDVPANARWYPVSGPEVTATAPDCAVYELVWQEQETASEGISQRKWRVFVDVKTHLPKRTESYVKVGSESEHKLEKYVLVTYPSEEEIGEIVAKIIDRSERSKDDVEYIPTPGIGR
jgi:hypothetical protein